MSVREFDPKETYILREVFCCGEGHCPGIRYTHWESGEACLYVHKTVTDNSAEHFYDRLALVPKNRGNPDPEKDQYADENGDFWEYAQLPKNENKWCFLIVLDRLKMTEEHPSLGEIKVGTVFKPGEAEDLVKRYRRVTANY